MRYYSMIERLLSLSLSKQGKCLPFVYASGIWWEESRNNEPYQCRIQTHFFLSSGFDSAKGLIHFVYPNRIA